MQQNFSNFGFESSSLSVPNPKRTTMFDFLSSNEGHGDSVFAPEQSPPPPGFFEQPRVVKSVPLPNRSPNSPQDIRDDMQLPLGGSQPWNGLDILGKIGSQQSNEVPFGSATSNQLSPSWKAKDLDVNWPLGNDPVIPPLISGSSRAASALGLAADVPMAAQQPISRPVSTAPSSSQLLRPMSSNNLGSVLSNNLGFQRAITPPNSSLNSSLLTPRPMGMTPQVPTNTPFELLGVGSSKSISPLPLGASDGILFSSNAGISSAGMHGEEESRWPKPVRYSGYYQNNNHNQSHGAMDSILGGMLRGNTSSVDLSILGGGTAGSLTSSTAPGRASANNIHMMNNSSILSPLSQSMASPSLFHTPSLQTAEHIPREALESYRISREPTPHLPQNGHNVGRVLTPPPANNSNKTGFNSLDDRAVENVIANNCYQILMDAAEHMLKAVELANTLRARVGTEVLALVRERWGGLLSLLERHPDRFVVERIPKNDRVLLADAVLAAGARKPTSGATDGEGGVTSADDETSEAKLGTSDHHSASRCLHVGNVPNHYTEVQLMRDFEKFGQLDGLKLIHQKNGQRRFAFITFKTVDQAITARHCLSKLHPWKSAISFAHKDLMRGGDFPGVVGNDNNQFNGQNNQSGNGYASNSGKRGPHGATGYVNNASGNSVNGNSSFNGYNNGHPRHNNGVQYGGNGYVHRGMHQHSVHQPQHLDHFNSSGNGYQDSYNQNAPAYSQHPHQQQQNSLFGRANDPSNTRHVSAPLASADPSLLSSASATTGSTAPPQQHQNIDQQQALMQRILQQQSTRVTSASTTTTNQVNGNDHEDAFERDFHTQSVRENSILQRLCDDTYVPTQPWPLDVDGDVIVCQAICDQLSQFGGATTISKLRGFLKHRMGTSDNIKSVPLKALLLAYTQLFRVEGNFVTLLLNSTTSVSSSSTAQTSTSSAVVINPEEEST